MSDFLRNNWFVVLIAVIIIGFIGYFIYDTNKDNVSAKTSNNEQVVASIDGDDITAKDLYDESAPYDGSTIYNMYKNAVIDQSIKTTKDLKKQANTLESNIKQNASNQSDDYESTLTSELAKYGYSSFDDLNNYCLTSVKEKEMNKRYITKHYNDVKKAWEEKSPRTVSIIKMDVSDADNLSETETKKKNNIDKALTKESFADVAKAFSEDSNTANNKGFAGYIDSDSASSSDSSSSSTVPADVVTAAISLKKGETSDWITVTSSSGTSLYKVYVNQTNAEKIFNAKSNTVANQALYAILNSDSSLANKILESYAKKLDIKFNDKSTKKKFDNYVKSNFGGDQ
ncbi:peptidylprolyl isomerase [uncultured Holdemanella sp.]|uniref:peptidylprolyl isomerase n=1 Tax=uncultured Holdemanella sp. TaxID=1763549 RepID=UPI0025D811AA|nr:peptidylprolyl isomerase [uncultured Holdemanella sp.]